MGYILNAIIVNRVNHESLKQYDLVTVPLEINIVMIPIDYSKYEEEFLSYPNGLKLPPLLVSLCEDLSDISKTLYIEAEYHGGTGAQTSTKFFEGKKIEETILDNEAINIGLKWLGVKAETPPPETIWSRLFSSKHRFTDEFDTIGLGRFRSTEDWISHSKDISI